MHTSDDPTTYERWVDRTAQGGFTSRQAELIVDLIGIEAVPATLARLLDEGVWPARIAEVFTADQATTILLLAAAKAGLLRRLPAIPAVHEWSTVGAAEAPLNRRDLDEALWTMTRRMLGVAMVLFGLLAWLVIAIGAAQR